MVASIDRPQDLGSGKCWVNRALDKVVGENLMLQGGEIGVMDDADGFGYGIGHVRLSGGHSGVGRPQSPDGEKPTRSGAPAWFALADSTRRI
ncbi:hypothetical protein BM221_009072 [Beauveria bassiana]|uniref:Uncharacterized protein n=1 Tax=Beauveria bassiana TaxID=176275 RepID=A0A2N6NC74_BEABA|nr:hypothetical protein BM221_009072 [Beauveria bassiana]